MRLIIYCFLIWQTRSRVHLHGVPTSRASGSIEVIYCSEWIPHVAYLLHHVGDSSLIYQNELLSIGNLPYFLFLLRHPTLFLWPLFFSVDRASTDLIPPLGHHKRNKW